MIIGISSVDFKCPFNQGDPHRAVLRMIYNMLGAPLREWCLAFARPDCTNSPRNSEGTYKREPLRIHGFWEYQTFCGWLKGVQKC